MEGGGEEGYMVYGTMMGVPRGHMEISGEFLDIFYEISRKVL